MNIKTPLGKQACTQQKYQRKNTGKLLYHTGARIQKTVRKFGKYKSIKKSGHVLCTGSYMLKKTLLIALALHLQT